MRESRGFSGTKQKRAGVSVTYVRNYGRWFRRLFLFVLLVACVVAWRYGYGLLNTRITRVKIEGQYASVRKSLVENTILPFIQQGFLRVDMNALQAALLEMPMIAKTALWREWPHTLVVYLKARSPVVSWNTNRYISRGGVVFPQDMVVGAQHLPALHGPEGYSNEVFARYRVANDLLEKIGLAVRAMWVTSRASVIVETNNGIRLNIGQRDLTDTLKRLVSVYPQVVGQHSAEVEYIDLRYPHGMAIKWKTTSS